MMKKGNFNRYVRYHSGSRQKAEGTEYKKGELDRWMGCSFTVTTERYAYEVYDDYYAGFDDPDEVDSNGYKTLEMARKWVRNRMATMIVRNGRYELVYHELREPEAQAEPYAEEPERL